MAELQPDQDYVFQVFTETLEPFGPVRKENLDVVRLEFDFSCYLEQGEHIDSMELLATSIPSAGSPQVGGRWQADFPLQCATDVPLSDDFTLNISVDPTINPTTEITMRVWAGTPGFTYVVSFFVITDNTQRRKQVDTLVVIEPAVNSLTVGPGTLILPPAIIGDTIDLPVGFDGLLVLKNSTNRPNIVITLPPAPTLGQIVDFIDALGTDSTYPVTFLGAVGVAIDGDGSTGFVSDRAYDYLRFIWTGANWHQGSLRISFMAGT